MALTGSQTEINIPMPVASRAKAKPRRGRKRPAEIDISRLLAQLDCEFAQEEEVGLNGNGHFSSVLGRVVEHSTYPKFSPSLNIQRFYRTYEILLQMISSAVENNNVNLPKIVMDVGCAQFGMHVYLNKIRDVGRLIYIDNNTELLRRNTKALAQPFPRRETPMKVQVFDDNFINLNPSLLNIQGESVFAAFALDVLEYCDLKNLDMFTHTMFGTFAPSIVIITTPNSEFRRLYKFQHGDFRLPKQQFLWSREEFEKWCNLVCQKYPSYSFTTEGIGNGPPETQHVGCASQMAIFKKVDDIDMRDFNALPERNGGFFQDHNNKGHLQPLYEAEYSYDTDQSPIEEKIIKEFESYINVCLFSPWRIEEYIQQERNQIEYPLNMVLTMPGIPSGVTMEEIKKALRGANYKLVENKADLPFGMNAGTCVVLPVPQLPNNEFYSSEETESDEEFQDTRNERNDDYENAPPFEEEIW